MSNLSRLTVPLCGLLIGSSALCAIAFHEKAAAALTGPTAEPLVATAPIEAEPVAEHEIVTAAEEVPAIDRTDPRAYGFVIRAAGASYVQLTTDATEIPDPTGRVHLEMGDGPVTAYATVAAADLPERLHDWVGKRVVVDGTCSARVVGFAKISRLEGETSYAGIDHAITDGAVMPWTPALAMEHGSAMLAAKLDGCTGTWARDAALPALARGIPLPVTPALVTAARVDLLATDEAAQAATESGFSLAKDADQIGIEARYAIHPLTGERWLVVHAHTGQSCGDPTIDITGVYRVEATGTLVRVAAYASAFTSIDDLVDVDGDGAFELRVRTFDADAALVDRDGSPVTVTTLPFFGCPC